jgi:hypothetical protein
MAGQYRRHGSGFRSSVEATRRRPSGKDDREPNRSKLNQGAERMHLTRAELVLDGEHQS